MKRKDSFSKTHKWTWYLKCTLTPLWLVLISVGAGGNLATSQSKPQELELARGGGLVVAGPGRCIDWCAANLTTPMVALVQADK